MTKDEIKKNISYLSSWITSWRRQATQNLYNSMSISSSPLMVNMGAIPPLVNLLSDTDKEVTINALKILKAFVDNNEELIVEAGAIPPLVSLLSTADGMAKKYALNILSKLAANTSNTTLIAQAGAVPLLVELLGGNTYSETKHDALNILSSFDDANNTASITASIVKIRAIPWLVGLLSQKDHISKINALTILARLVENISNIVTMTEARAIPLLSLTFRDLKYDDFLDEIEHKAISNALYVFVKLIENAHKNNNMVSIDNVDIIYPISRLLGAKDRTVRENAIYLFLMLVENVDNKPVLVDLAIHLLFYEKNPKGNPGNGQLLLNLIADVNIGNADSKRLIAKQMADAELISSLSKAKNFDAFLTFAEYTDDHVFIAKIIGQLIRILRDGDKDLHRKSASKLAMIVEKSTRDKKTLILSDDMLILRRLMTREKDEEIKQNIQKILDMCQDIVKTNKIQADVVEKRVHVEEAVIDATESIPLLEYELLLQDTVEPEAKLAVELGSQNDKVGSQAETTTIVPMDLEEKFDLRGPLALDNVDMMQDEAVPHPEFAAGIDLRTDQIELLSDIVPMGLEEKFGLRGPLALDNVDMMQDEAVPHPEFAAGIDLRTDQIELLSEINTGVLPAYSKIPVSPIDRFEPAISFKAFRLMQDEIKALQAQKNTDLDFLDTKKLKAIIAEDSAQEMLELEKQAILKDKHQRAYYQAMRLYVSELVVAATGIASGYIDINRSSEAKAVGFVCDAMSSAFPGFSAVTSIAKGGINQLDKTYRKHFLKSIRVLGPTVSEADLLGEELARLLVRAYYHATRPLSVEAAERDARRLICGVMKAKSDSYTALELFRLVWNETSFSIEEIPSTDIRFEQKRRGISEAETPKALIEESIVIDLRAALLEEQTARKALQEQLAELQIQAALKSDVPTQQDLNRIDREIAKLHFKTAQSDIPVNGQRGQILANHENHLSISAANEEIRWLKQQLERQDKQLCLLTETLRIKNEEEYAVSAKAITQSGYFAENNGTSVASAIDTTKKRQLFGRF